MARIFRLWEKKRGDRRTGSKLVGGLGEAVFFGLLFLLGSISLAYLITEQVLHPAPDRYVLGMGFWLLVLVFASFVLIGGGGFVVSMLQVGASVERRSALAKRAADIDLTGEGASTRNALPTVPRDTNLTNSPGIRLAFRLPISETRAWQLLAASAFCLVWNVIATVLVTIAANSHLDRRPDWLLTLFVIPFVAIGVWAIYYFVQQVILHTGIGPTSVEISAHPLRPGREYDVFLSQSGRLKLASLELLLVCEEEATYQQGTDIRTERSRVFKQRLFRQEDFRITPGMPFEHQCRFPIPPAAMHSFQAQHNAVHWKLVVRGDAVSWPAFDRAFPVVVVPNADGEASRE